MKYSEFATKYLQHLILSNVHQKTKFFEAVLENALYGKGKNFFQTPKFTQTRKILTEIDCEFCVPMKYSFQDKDYIYLVCEDMDGGD